MDLGVTVLAGLGGGHFNDLARTALQDNVTVLAQSGTLHWVGRRRARGGCLELVIMISVSCHGV